MERERNPAGRPRPAQRGWLAELVRARCLKTGTFRLQSGRTSDYYLDLRLLTLSNELTRIVEAVHAEAADAGWLYNTIGGPTTAADPIVGGYLVHYYGVRCGFMVRPAPKDHGTGGQVVGPLAAGDRCLLVDDVLTTGRSLIRAAEAVTALGAVVAGAVVVADRGEGGQAALAEHGIEVRSVLTAAEIFG